ncbi:MAG TPA: hypothetical protein VMV44_16495 [Rectinemataceae bacterium]|nr:hypothetical protein [Rectinemataceae bacterium]
MRQASSARLLLTAVAIAIIAATAADAADAKAGTLTCVGLYSETDAGYVSFRVGSGAWTVVKPGDVIPAAAEIRVNVDRDWVEFVRTGVSGAVYEIDGSEKGAVLRKVSDILKDKPRPVALPKGSAKTPDPKFKDLLVVTQYLGRQIYFSADGDSRDIKYGDVLEAKGTVSIIGINNTLTLMNASSAVTTVIGPLKFSVGKVLANQNLYKFLNVQN